MLRRFLSCIVVVTALASYVARGATVSLMVSTDGTIVGPVTGSVFVATNGIATITALESVSNAWYNTPAAGITIAQTNLWTSLGAWYSNNYAALDYLTNNAASYDAAAANAISATNRCAILESHEPSWQTALNNSISATSRLDLIDVKVPSWDKAVSDSGYATNWINTFATNALTWNDAWNVATWSSNQVSQMLLLAPGWNQATNDATLATNTLAVITSSTSAWSAAAATASGVTSLSNDWTTAYAVSASLQSWASARSNYYDYAYTATLAQASWSTSSSNRYEFAYTNVVAITPSTTAWNTASTRAAAWETWADENTNRLVTTATFSRYLARDTADSEVMVCASGTGITAAVAGNVVTISIPDGVTMTSCRVRWPAAFGSSSFVLDVGTTDMPNTANSERWGPLFQAYREDTGAYIATASASMDMVNKSKVNVSGLIISGSVVNHCSFSF